MLDVFTDVISGSGNCLSKLNSHISCYSVLQIVALSYCQITAKLLSYLSRAVEAALQLEIEKI